jgi:hypothetical protein
LPYIQTVAIDLRKAERLQSKIESLIELLRDKELQPLIPHLLEQESPIIAVHNGTPIQTNNRTYTGVTQAIRSIRKELPGRFTRADAMQKLHERGSNYTEDSIKDALYGMQKKGELKQYLKQGQPTEYEFTK